MFFLNLSPDDTIFKIKRAAILPASDRREISELLTSAAFDITGLSERFSFEGNLWYAFLAYRLASDENALGRICEMSNAPVMSLKTLAARELWTLRKVIAIVDDIASDCGLSELSAYSASLRCGRKNESVAKPVLELAEKIACAASSSELVEHLIVFYSRYGSGVFALNSAFRWGEGAGLLPANDLDPTTLDSLVGYEEQKKELISNTESFLSGLDANNALLFGDSGTGKSSSVRALLNVPGFVARGLRMIEIRKDQFREIPAVLSYIRDRNYRFIIFMDDLSFEDFETEYKYLKAIIEGGIEQKPQNTVIYATSNRRNLVRELWSDRKANSADVHGGDTMQEKMSLSDRFGVTIWYGPVGKNGYMEMVEAMAGESGIDMPPEELERLALRWEIGKGSFTGRTARQFIRSLMAGNV